MALPQDSSKALALNFVVYFPINPKFLMVGTLIFVALLCAILENAYPKLQDTVATEKDELWKFPGSNYSM